MSSPRQTNRLRKPIGKHFTLTRVVLNPDGKFGFALGDDGETNAYLPRSIIERYGITPEDEGAGFSSPLKPNSERPGEHPWVMAPLIWDDDLIDEVEEVLAKFEDLPEIIRNVDNAINVLTLCRRELQEKADWVKENYDAV